MWALMKNNEEEEGEAKREEGGNNGKYSKKQTGLLDSYGKISNNYCISLFLILPSALNS